MITDTIKNIPPRWDIFNKFVNFRVLIKLIR